MSERLQLIIKANKLSASEFADTIGVNRASLSHVLSGRNKPSMDFLSKIIEHFPNVNASWLLTGETREGGFKGEQVVNRGEHGVQKSELKEVDRIVIFYTDGTFSQHTEVTK